MLGISTNFSGGIDRDGIKRDLEGGFLEFIISKIVYVAVNKFESTIKNPKDPWGLKVVISGVKVSIGIGLAIFGYILQDQLNQLGDGFIIGDISLLNGLQESVLGLVDLIVQIFALLSPKHQSEAGQLTFDIINFAFGIVKIGVAIKHMAECTSLGQKYGFETIGSSLLDLDEALDRIANFESNAVLLQPFIALAKLIKPIIPIQEDNIPLFVMGLDCIQLFIGEIYIVQL